MIKGFKKLSKCLMEEWFVMQVRKCSVCETTISYPARVRKVVRFEKDKKIVDQVEELRCQCGNLVWGRVLNLSIDNIPPETKDGV
jgi:hypothetical protein